MNDLITLPTKHDISRGLDDAVAEVFDFMLDMPCLPRETSNQGATDPCMTVEIEISGVLNGCCMVYLTPSAVDAITTGLLGFPTEDTALVEDAAREIGNVIIGRWKNGLGGEVAASRISVPFLIHKARYAPCMSPVTLRIHRQYTFSDIDFGVQILIDQPAAVPALAYAAA